MGFPDFFFIIIKMNNILLLQDMYNIGILTVNMKDSLKRARLSPVSKLRHINSMFTVNTPILYIPPASNYETQRTPMKIHVLA